VLNGVRRYRSICRLIGLDSNLILSQYIPKGVHMRLKQVWSKLLRRTETVVQKTTWSDVKVNKLHSMWSGSIAGEA